MARWGHELSRPEVWVRDIVFTAAVALTISFLGPYGSYDRPLVDRIVTSFAFGFVGGLWIWPVMRIALHAGARAGLPRLFTLVAGLMILTAPVAVASHLIDRALHPDHVNPAPVILYLSVLALVLPLGVGYLTAERWLDRPTTPEAAPDPSRPPRLFDRIPARLGRDLVALQAEDHYVRIHTALGSELVLMRLADAIAETDGASGLRVHRSWWVAKSAVVSARAEGRRAALTLTNGAVAPVTREAVPAVRREGWL